MASALSRRSVVAAHALFLLTYFLSFFFLSFLEIRVFDPGSRNYAVSKFNSPPDCDPSL